MKRLTPAMRLKMAQIKRNCAKGGVTLSIPLTEGVPVGVPSDIFKIQRPLFSTDPDPHLLVYNADRSVHFETQQADLVEHFKGPLAIMEAKYYARCTLGQTAEGKTLKVVEVLSPYHQLW